MICSTDSDEDAKTRMQEKNKNNSPSLLSLHLDEASQLFAISPMESSQIDAVGYVAELIHQNEFNVTFRMSQVSFQKLAELLRPALSVNESPSYCALSGSGLVLPELVIAMSLRWLAGGQWQDIEKVYGVNRSHFYFLGRKFMDAVMACPVLQIRPPDASDIDGLKRLALHFDAATCFKARLQGLCWISEPENVLAYYSGHYRHDSLNIQAMSNHCGKFLYFAVAAPGVSLMQKHLP